MLIRVDEIPESGRFLHFHWDNERFSQFLPPEDPFEMKLVRPVNVDLEIYRHKDHVRVLGTIKGVLQVGCHRCLKPFDFSLDEQVDVYLIEERDAPQEDETELEAEEMEYEFFDGEIIDVDQLVVEQIFLALPYKVLCSEDCKGICAGCGANLNDEPCRCSKDAKGSPFAGLSAIKDKLPEE
ncbi:MAG: YceD family protein [Acidobacteriota bacterium]